jgi:hypothetical protein
MPQREARRDTLDDHFFTTALGWGLDDESERLTGAFDQLAPAPDGADQGSRSRAHMLTISPTPAFSQYSLSGRNGPVGVGAVPICPTSPANGPKVKFSPAERRTH